MRLKFYNYISLIAFKLHKIDVSVTVVNKGRVVTSVTYSSDINHQQKRSYPN